MSRISFRRLVIAALLALPFLLLPISAFAQEAAISGTVTDQTGGVLPGVVVRAVNDANGNSFEAVTDSTGKYLLTVRIGDYRVGAELALIATSFGQPRFSKDTIAEFEVITNRFDARQGRSTGIQVNAITKSGTNTAAGSLAGYFRDDRFNAADFIQKKVLPYSDQQVTTTWGGPIKRDRIHYFLNYEYERSPYTRPYTTPYPAFNINLQGTYTEKKGGGRVDIQFSPKTHFVYRQNLQRSWDPYDARSAGGSTIHPSSPSSVPQTANDITTRLTRVINSSAVNEVAYSWGRYWWETNPVVNWPNHPQASAGFTHGTPRILLRGYTIGQAHTRSPQDLTDGGPSLPDS